MKNLILIFSVLLSTSLSAVEYGFITNATADDFTDRVILNSGDFLDILGLSPKDNNYSYLLVASLDADIDNLDNSAEILINESFGTIIQSGLKTITGPSQVRVRRNGNDGNQHVVMFYKITRASEMQYQNGNIVSVPSDVQGAGTHNIVVETSSDLINWTPVHSSAISGGSEAFIRTRISTSE
jgi:hypothetical protein